MRVAARWGWGKVAAGWRWQNGGVAEGWRWQQGGGDRNNSSGAWPLSRGDQVVGGGDEGGQAGAAAAPNSRDGINKDGESKQDDAT